MENVPYDKRQGKIWYNGNTVDWRDANLHILSHGLHYASCVFEGERIYNGSIFKLREHTNRLIHSADRMGFKIPYSADEIDNACKEIFEYMNVYQERITFKREVIADHGVWLAKKRYALNVYDSEGIKYEEPKLKVQGMEIVRSCTPASVRSTLKESVNIVLTKDEETLRNYVRDIEDKWHKLPPPDIAFPRTVNNVTEYKDSSSIFRKGTPIHVRGALLYNFHNKKNKLKHKYPLIQDGEKIKFVYLKTPNKIGENVISFLNTFPREFGLDKQVDYDLQFNKSFLEPIKVIMDTIGWKPEKVANLEFLFG